MHRAVHQKPLPENQPSAASVCTPAHHGCQVVAKGCAVPGQQPRTLSIQLNRCFARHLRDSRRTSLHNSRLHFRATAVAQDGDLRVYGCAFSLQPKWTAACRSRASLHSTAVQADRADGFRNEFHLANRRARARAQSAPTSSAKRQRLVPVIAQHCCQVSAQRRAGSYDRLAHSWVRENHGSTHNPPVGPQEPAQLSRGLSRNFPNT